MSKIKLHDEEIDISKLAIELDYDAELYHPRELKEQAGNLYGYQYSNFRYDAYHGLLELIKHLDRRIDELTKLNDLLATNSKPTGSTSNAPK